MTNDIIVQQFACILVSWRRTKYAAKNPNLKRLNMININMQFIRTTGAMNCTGIAKMISTSYQLSKELPKNLKGRSKSSQEWLIRQLADTYVEKARMLKYRYCSP